MFNAMDIARCLAELGYDADCPEESVQVSPLRLQKFLYYCQGWSLALLGEPLFRQPIEAWKHGPVVREVYNQLAGRRTGIAPDELGGPCETMPEHVQQLLEMVWRQYNAYRPHELVEMTHREPAWIEARNGLPADASSSAPLSLETMARHFREQAEALEKERGRYGWALITPQESWQAEREANPSQRTYSVAEVLKRTRERRSEITHG